MSKEKKEKVEKSTDKIDEILRKEYGDVFISPSSLLEKEKKIISISPTFDLMLGGGIPEGAFVIITGPPKVGKSTFCLHVASKAQKEGFKVYYFSVEGRLQKRDIQGIPELDLSEEKFEIIGSSKGNLLDAEKYLDILVRLIENKERCLFIMDSISQLCGSTRHASNVGDRQRDDVPLMLASLTKKIANTLPINDNILMCITHRIANQGAGHSPWSEASGQKVQYQTDIKLKATHSTDYLVGEKQVGQIVHWVCDTSCLGPPGGKTSSLLRYGSGIDEYYDMIDMCADIGLVKKGGAWYTFINEAGEEEKAQGIEKAVEYLRNNPKLYAKIAKDFAETFK